MGETLPQAQISYAVPSLLAKQMDAGEVDIALLSSIELVNHPEYSYIPGLGICSDGPVRSVCLYLKKDLKQVKTVALDLNSVTSITLLRMMMEEYWAIHPHYLHFTPPLSQGLQIADAALTIGDSTLKETNSNIQCVDLGKAWQEWTGLPFVYAVWITREGIDPLQYAKAFHRAKDLGMQNLDEVIRRSRKVVERSEKFFREYFTEHVYYELNERERIGMALFFEKARKYLLEKII